MSETIHVRSIVGTFLEHSRIFYFENDGNCEIYMGSADWMPRNLDKRVEILFPVEDEKLKEEIIHILDVQLSDNLKSHILLPDDVIDKEKDSPVKIYGGVYKKSERRGKVPICSQMEFCREAMERFSEK
jgi:polyphosphate kinase